MKNPKKKIGKRKLNLAKCNEEVIELEDNGHHIVRFTDYHWRIDEKIDVWPSSKKYMLREGIWRTKNFESLKDIFLDSSILKSLPSIAAGENKTPVGVITQD